MSIRVTIFEDNDTRRDGLKLLLDSSPGFECAGAFENCAHVMKDILDSQPDVVLMDIEMPGINGIEAVKMIKEQYPAMPVMMQTVFDHDEKVFQCILAGATGYMLKKTPPVKLLEAVQEISEGGAPMTPEIAMKVLQFFKQKETIKNDLTYLLTEKENDILSLLVEGLSYKMIADRLSISYHTVNFHIRNIYQKLHVHSVGEAVAKAIRENIV
ncbi:MAG TPA: response regulator transcription factor [Chitinophagales bacterium]|nr:response regulator transcription factor [Chitinophagales bacterium]